MQPLTPELLACHRAHEILEFVFRKVLAYPAEPIEKITPYAALTLLGTLRRERFGVNKVDVNRHQEIGEDGHAVIQSKDTATFASLFGRDQSVRELSGNCREKFFVR